MFQTVWMSLNEPSDFLQKPPEASRATVCLQPGLGEVGKDIRMLLQCTCTTSSLVNAGMSQGPSSLPTTLQEIFVQCLCVARLGVFAAGCTYSYLDPCCASANGA